MNLLRDRGWLYLIPGFLALFVASFVSDFPEIRDTQLPIVYISLTFISAIIPFIVVHLVLRFRKKVITIDYLQRSPWFISSVFFCSIGVGLLFGILHTTDVVSHSLRELIGKRLISVVSHDELVRELFSRSYSGGFPDGRVDFNSNTPSLYLRIAFEKDSKIYEGVAENWYGGKTRPQIYLSPACRIESSVAIPVHGPGVWLDLKGVQDIQFIDDGCSICSTSLERAAGRTPNPKCSYSSIKNN